MTIADLSAVEVLHERLRCPGCAAWVYRLFATGGRGELRCNVCLLQAEAARWRARHLLNGKSGDGGDR